VSAHHKGKPLSVRKQSVCLAPDLLPWNRKGAFVSASLFFSVSSQGLWIVSPRAFAASLGESIPRPRDVTAIILVKGEQRGSGVFLRRAEGGTWLVTNRHVVDGYDSVCMQSSDGRLWPGKTILLAGKPSSLDLAFVWLSSSGESPPLAITSSSPVVPDRSKAQTWDFPVVLASGYPVEEGSNKKPPAYKELAGLLLPLLSQPLEGGLQLTTTALVRKGMSGGGLFDAHGFLIGINATHADPLWSAPLRDEAGRSLSPQLNRQLEFVAMAIPIETVLPLINTLATPSFNLAKDLVTNSVTLSTLPKGELTPKPMGIFDKACIY
jgi:S1-C subfamily serine protease